MSYRFAVERLDASDLAGGYVLHALPGAPALPVRLADELFQRCLAARPPQAGDAPLVLFDPCCGAGYHLTVLGLLHARRLQSVLGVEIDPNVAQVAQRNLQLLHPAGLDARAAFLAQQVEAFGKESHRQAAAAALRLRGRLEETLQGRTLQTGVWVANALDGRALLGALGPQRADLVLADVPYGLHSHWQGQAALHAPAAAGAGTDELTALLEALRGVLAPGAVVGLVSDKGQKAAHPAYRRVERFQIGKRRMAVLALEG